LAFVAWRIFSLLHARPQVPAWRAQGAQVVDVRSSQEFAKGHADDAINIPLSEIRSRAVAELDRHRPVIVCCASGTRSAIARRQLVKLGFPRVLNAGAWRNVG
jgi:rhodanese-related sulfurtransferase